MVSQSGTNNRTTVSKLRSAPHRTQDLQKGREKMIFFLLCLNSLALTQPASRNTAAFDDLGKLLLGGVAAAIVCAVAFTFVRFRLRDKKPQTSNFISISSAREEVVDLRSELLVVHSVIARLSSSRRSSKKWPAPGTTTSSTGVFFSRSSPVSADARRRQTHRVRREPEAKACDRTREN